mmetsp:Transcript_7680/g.14226  ORF Transcript_7680/g.14226 Transcript_7680/m.14226 type:complete len:451 (-) Transcript_7680:95-1447(-)
MTMMAMNQQKTSTTNMKTLFVLAMFALVVMGNHLVSSHEIMAVVEAVEEAQEAMICEPDCYCIPSQKTGYYGYHRGHEDDGYRDLTRTSSGACPPVGKRLPAAAYQAQMIDQAFKNLTLKESKHYDDDEDDHHHDYRRDESYYYDHHFLHGDRRSSFRKDVCQPYYKVVRAGIVDEPLCKHEEEGSKGGKKREKASKKESSKKEKHSKKSESEHNSKSRSKDEKKDPVCAFVYDVEDSCSSYRIKTFSSKHHAVASDYSSEVVVITHEGSCGACSSAQDLAVYMNPALGVLSYRCSDLGLPYEQPEDFDTALQCYQGLGFTDECAYVWASNGANTALSGCTESCEALFGICRDPDMSCPMPDCLGLGCLGPPPQFQVNLNDANCDLVDCIECDEKKSGRLFQKFAGRTRRNSGLLTTFQIPPNNTWVGLKRDCDSIANIMQGVPGPDVCK